MRLIRTDNAETLIKTCRDLQLVRDASQPGVPQTKGKAERAVQDVLAGTKAALLQAGLPPIFWSFAAPCYCLLRNTTEFGGHVSPYAKTHKVNFQGNRIPFGARVEYLPSPTKMETQKWETDKRIGVFAGYVLHPGCVFKGEYKVWDITDFTDDLLLQDREALGQRILHPHITKRASLFEGRVFFPMKAAFVELNATYEGVRKWRAAQVVPPGTSPFAPPPLPPPERPPPGDFPVVDAPPVEHPTLVVPKGVEVSPPRNGEEVFVTTGGQVVSVDKDNKIRLIIDQHLSDVPPVVEGNPGDGKIYMGQNGKICKIDRRGRSYPVNPDGTRFVGAISRPLAIPPVIWDKMSFEEKAKLQQEVKDRWGHLPPSNSGRKPVASRPPEASGSGLAPGDRPAKPDDPPADLIAMASQPGWHTDVLMRPILVTHGATKLASAFPHCEGLVGRRSTRTTWILRAAWKLLEDAVDWEGQERESLALPGGRADRMITMFDPSVGEAVAAREHAGDIPVSTRTIARTPGIIP